MNSASTSQRLDSTSVPEGNQVTTTSDAQSPGLPDTSLHADDSADATPRQGGTLTGFQKTHYCSGDWSCAGVCKSDCSDPFAWQYYCPYFCLSPRLLVAPCCCSLKPPLLCFALSCATPPFRQHYRATRSSTRCSSITVQDYSQHLLSLPSLFGHVCHPRPSPESQRPNMHPCLFDYQRSPIITQAYVHSSTIAHQQ